MIPGMFFAIIYFNVAFTLDLLINIIVGVISTCFIALANYVINQWLDAEFDKYHPVKKNRPSVTKSLSAPFIYLEYFMISSLALSLAYYISLPFFLVSALLLVMGILCNVRPFRIIRSISA